VPTNKNRGVTITPTNVFIIPLTTCSVPDRPSSSDNEKYANGDAVHIKLQCRLDPT
jgi:hypothetical protein